MKTGALPPHPLLLRLLCSIVSAEKACHEQWSMAEFTNGDAWFEPANQVVTLSMAGRYIAYHASSAMEMWCPRM